MVGGLGFTGIQNTLYSDRYRLNIFISLICKLSPLDWMLKLSYLPLVFIGGLGFTSMQNTLY